MKKLCLLLITIVSFTSQAQVKIGEFPDLIIPGAFLQINGTATLPPLASTFEQNTMIFKDGRFGIGTLSPSSELDVVTSNENYTSFGIINNSTNHDNSITGHKWFFNSLGAASNSPGAFLIWDGTAMAGRFIIDANGRTGIGTMSPSSELEVNGEIEAIAIKGPSDLRFKKNINPLEKSLEKITSLNGYSYEWRKDEFPKRSFKEGIDIGLIAQEVEKVVPQIVYTANDEMQSKSIDYARLVPLLIESIKELKNEIDELKAQLNTLEKSKTVALESSK